MRCAFGATRVGALLGRLRLHLQTERFLAVRRDDAMWEAACVLASVALGDMVAGLAEDEMQAPLSRPAQPPVLVSAPSGDRLNGALMALRQAARLAQRCQAPRLAVRALDEGARRLQRRVPHLSRNLSGRAGTGGLARGHHAAALSLRSFCGGRTCARASWSTLRTSPAPANAHWVVLTARALEERSRHPGARHWAAAHLVTRVGAGRIAIVSARHNSRGLPA